MPNLTRFKDNTTTRPIDRTRVYGFSGGVPNMSMRPVVSNLQAHVIPQGQLLMFKPRVDNINRLIDSTVHVEQQETSPTGFLNAVAAKFQRGVRDFGFRGLPMLTPLQYGVFTFQGRMIEYDEADDYFAIVHPPLSCEMGLEVAPNEPCPTCRIQWLESAECSRRIADALQNADKWKHAVCANRTFDQEILNSLRSALLDSYQAARAFATYKLGRSKGDVEARKGGSHGKSSLDAVDHYYQRMLHEKPDHITQAEMITKQAEITGAAMAEALRRPAEADKEVAALREQIAALQAKLTGTPTVTVPEYSDTQCLAVDPETGDPCPNKGINGACDEPGHREQVDTLALEKTDED